jgi:hypothetical protein
VTAALTGAVLLSALLAQAKASPDAGTPMPTPLAATPDAGAPAEGPSAPVAPLSGPSPAAPPLPTTSDISAQALPAAPAPGPAEEKPADVNKAVGMWLPPH